MAEQIPGYVTVRELADLLDTTVRGVYHRRNAGQLPDDWEQIGRQIVWPRATIDQFMQGDGARIRTINQLYRRAREERHARTQDG
jgi:predicted DNA-binding transcriptional regulator AlpA